MLVRTGPTRRCVAPRTCGFIVNTPSPGGEPTMTRTLKGSLLIASMLVVAWATTSEACHRRRAAATATSYSSCYSSGYTYLGVHLRGLHGLLRRRGRLRHGWRGLLRRRVCRRHGRLSRRYGYDYGRPGYNPGGLGGPMSGLGVRPGLGFGAPGMVWAGAGAASAGRRPGWGCGPAWASAAWAGALTVPRSSDHPAGARRPGPTGSLGAVSAAAS